MREEDADEDLIAMAERWLHRLENMIVGSIAGGLFVLLVHWLTG